MENVKKILVFENDSEHAGKNLAIQSLGKTIPVEMWWDFNISFERDREEAFKKLSEIDENTLVVSNPSFAGQHNQFDRYVTLFLKLKEMNIKLNISIIFYDGFFKYMLDFLYKDGSLEYKQNNHRMIKEILDFHNVYECKPEDIPEITEKSVLITYEDLMSYYIETHRKHPKTIVRVNETGEEYPVMYVNTYVDNVEDIIYEVLVSETPFKNLELKRNEFTIIS